MKPITLHTTPSDRARLRWVLDALGEGDKYGWMYAHPEWGDRIAFSASDGTRMHRTIIQDRRDNTLPLLGTALREPDLTGFRGEDVVSLDPPEVPIPVLDFHYLIGVAKKAQAAVRIEKREEFAAAVRQAAQERKAAVNRMRGVYLDLEAMKVHWPPPEKGLVDLGEADDVDGSVHMSIVDGAFLRDAVPGGKGPMIIRQGERTVLFETKDQVSVLMNMTELPPEGEEETE